MSSCSGNCSSCGSTSCGDRTAESLLAELNPNYWGDAFEGEKEVYEPGLYIPRSCDEEN